MSSAYATKWETTSNAELSYALVIDAVPRIASGPKSTS